MTQQAQQIPAEQQVIILKSQLFDAGQVQQQLQAQVNELSGALQQIVTTLGIQGDENGNVNLEQVVATVVALHVDSIDTGDAVEAAELNAVEQETAE